MWRSRAACLRTLAARLSAGHGSRRTFGGHAGQGHDGFAPLPPLRLLGPTVWSMAAVGTIYLGCAGYEVYQEVQHSRIGSTGTYDQLQAAVWNSNRRGWNMSHELTLVDLLSPGSSWNRLTGADKMVAGAVGLNTGIFAMSQVIARINPNLMHTPGLPRNYTLLTSNFYHNGFLPLAVNMYILLRSGPQVARSPVFERSGPHLTAFYLATGVLSSLAQHLTSKLRPLRGLPHGFSMFMAGGGSGGVIFGLIGVWGMLFIDEKMELPLVSVTVGVDSFLMGLAAFEAIGLVSGLAFMGTGQAAHLAGLAFGTGYVHFDGKRRVWQPAKRFMFHRMKGLGVV